MKIDVEDEKGREGICSFRARMTVKRLRTVRKAFIGTKARREGAKEKKEERYQHVFRPSTHVQDPRVGRERDDKNRRRKEVADRRIGEGEQKRSKEKA